MFSGSGPAVKELADVANKLYAKNTVFTGRYQKADEMNIVKDCSMINACTDRDVNSESLMSNRFYLSVTQRKPLMANTGTYQSEVSGKYGLGLSLSLNDIVHSKIKQYWESLDWKQYNHSCNVFLKAVKDDLEEFEKRITQLYRDLNETN